MFHLRDMAEKDWAVVRIPKPLWDRLKEIKDTKAFGYASMSDFVAEAIRERLLEVEEQFKKTKRYRD